MANSQRLSEQTKFSRKFILKLKLSIVIKKSKWNRRQWSVFIKCFQLQVEYLDIKYNKCGKIFFYILVSHNISAHPAINDVPVHNQRQTLPFLICNGISCNAFGFISLKCPKMYFTQRYVASPIATFSKEKV